MSINVNATTETAKSAAGQQQALASSSGKVPAPRPVQATPQKPLEPSLLNQVLSEMHDGDADTAYARKAQGGMRAKEGTSFDEELIAEHSDDDQRLDAGADQRSGSNHHDQVADAHIIAALREKNEPAAQEDVITGPSAKTVSPGRTATKRHLNLMQATVSTTGNETASQLTAAREARMSTIFSAKHWQPSPQHVLGISSIVIPAIAAG